MGNTVSFSRADVQRVQEIANRTPKDVRKNGKAIGWYYETLVKAVRSNLEQNECSNIRLTGETGNYLINRLMLNKSFDEVFNQTACGSTLTKLLNVVSKSYYIDQTTFDTVITPQNLSNLADQDRKY